jgi:lipopolysaccharide biosynthesis glycosyltransferase
MLAWSKRFPDNRFVDQNFLNFTFQFRYSQLDQKYNRLVSCIAPGDAFASRKPAIWHFAGEKPWQRLANEWDILYWRYLLQTPWRDTAISFLAALLSERQRVLTSRSWQLFSTYRRFGDWLKKRQDSF